MLPLTDSTREWPPPPPPVPRHTRTQIFCFEWPLVPSSWCCFSLAVHLLTLSLNPLTLQESMLLNLASSSLLLCLSLPLCWATLPFLVGVGFSAWEKSSCLSPSGRLSSHSQLLGEVSGRPPHTTDVAWNPGSASGRMSGGRLAGRSLPCESWPREGKELPHDPHKLSLLMEKTEAQADSAHQMCVCSSPYLGSGLREWKALVCERRILVFEISQEGNLNFLFFFFFLVPVPEAGAGCAWIMDHT